MKINVQSIKFDADQKLLDFIDKKVGKLEKFFDNIISCDVALTVQPDHGEVRQIVPRTTYRFSVTRGCPTAGRSRFLWR